MSKEKRPLPDEETKRKFREALERKQKGGGTPRFRRPSPFR